LLDKQRPYQGWIEECILVGLEGKAVTVISNDLGCLGNPEAIHTFGGMFETKIRNGSKKFWLEKEISESSRMNTDVGSLFPILFLCSRGSDSCSSTAGSGSCAVCSRRNFLFVIDKTDGGKRGEML
jgi:hypothetical protein